MKRKITLSIALALSVTLLSLTSSDRTAHAQNQIRVIADTGVVTLGPNQILRISGDGVDQDDIITLRFRQMTYLQNACSGSICKYSAASQTLSASVTLMPGEAASLTVGPDIQGNTVRVAVLSSSRNARVNVMIIDAATGEVVTAYVLKDVLISS
jgi:hypothetical protein